MPLPQTTLFRPDSVSKGGTCSLNLRGSTLYDYANSNVTWTHNGIFSADAISEQTTWTYFLPKKTNFDVSDVITRSSSLSTSRTNFTFMFRFLTNLNQSPGGTGTSIIFNGDAPPSPSPPYPNAFWGIYFNGFDSLTLQFQFVYLVGGNISPFIISTDSIEINRWYHIAITVSDNGDGTSTIKGFQDGVQRSIDPTASYMDAPSGTTKIGNGGFGQAQTFSLTDIVFLEKVLTDDEIVGYSLSAYI